MKNVNIGDQVIIAVVLGIICLIVGGVDFVIFCYWISFKFKEYSFQQTYGPILTFPPRGTEDTSVAELPTLPPVSDERSEPEFDYMPEPPPPSDEAVVISGPLPTASVLDIPVASPEIEEEYPPLDPNLIFAQGGIRSPFARTWSLVHPFVGIQFVLLLTNILAGAFLFPSIFQYGQDAMLRTYGLIVIIVSLFFQNAAFVGVTAYFLRGYGTSLKRIGLRAPTVREVALGLAYGAVLCLAAMAIEKGLTSAASHFLPKTFTDRLGGVDDALSAGGMFEKIQSMPLKIWFAIAGAVAAPIGEEVFFRGLLYNGLKRRWGIPAAVMVSAVCFAAIHFAPIAVLVIIPMGIALALAYEHAQSLWVTILMHAVNNGVQFGIAIYTMNQARPGH